MMHRRAIGGLVSIASLGWSLSATCEARAAGCLPNTVAAIGKLEARLLTCRAKIAATNDSSGAAACDAAATNRFLSNRGVSEIFTPEATTRVSTAHGVRRESRSI